MPDFGTIKIDYNLLQQQTNIINGTLDKMVGVTENILNINRKLLEDFKGSGSTGYEGVTTRIDKAAKDHQANLGDSNKRFVQAGEDHRANDNHIGGTFA